MKRKVKKQKFKLKQSVRVGKHQKQRRWVARLGRSIGFLTLRWMLSRQAIQERIHKKKNG
jgi:hypothetical protein